MDWVEGSYSVGAAYSEARSSGLSVGSGAAPDMNGISNPVSSTITIDPLPMVIPL
jgi:hypothetical protein